MRALEALPPGHPSSPYRAEGSRRTAEPNPRSRELPLPGEWDEEPDEWPGATEEGPADAGVLARDAGEGEGNAVELAGAAGGWDENAAGQAGDGGGPGWSNGAWGGTDFGRWDGNASEPGRGSAGLGGDERGWPRRADGPAAGTRERDRTEDGHEWPGAIGGESLQESRPANQGTADNAVGRTRSDDPQTADAIGPPEGLHHSYWTEVPRFKRMWAAHEAGWPKETQPTAKVDRSGDPPGSWRSDSNLLLNADVHAQTREAIGDVQRAERSTTECVHDLQRDNLHGGWLEGLNFRLKGEDRLKEKIAEVLKREPERTPDEVVREIPDAIRYTFCLNKEDYTDGYLDIRQRIEDLGYDMVYSKNYWDDPEYKGINTRWMTSDGHQFEIQFHTRESYHAKQEVTHGAYERIRNPLTSRAERTALHSFQREVSSWVPVPDGATDIPDYKRKGL